LKYRNYTVDGDGIVTVVTKNNVVPSCGRRYILDRIFSTGTHGWNDLRVAYLAVGTSTDTNSGVVGPTADVPVATTGSWTGPSWADYKLSTEIVRKACNVRRTGDVAYVRATFLNDDFDAFWTEYSDNIPIVEEGLFLSATEPTANPIDNATMEEHSMVSRATLTSNSGSGYYIVEPLYKPDNDSSFTIGYEWNWEGL